MYKFGREKVRSLTLIVLSNTGGEDSVNALRKQKQKCRSTFYKVTEQISGLVKFYQYILNPYGILKTNCGILQEVIALCSLKVYVYSFTRGGHMLVS